MRIDKPKLPPNTNNLTVPHFPHCRKKLRGKYRKVIQGDTDFSRHAKCNRCHATSFVWIGDATRAGYELAEPDLYSRMFVNSQIAHRYS